VDAAFVLEAFVYSDIDLGVKAVPTRVKRSTDNRRKRRVNQRLPAHYYKDSLFPWISSGRMLNEVELTPLHNGTW